MGNEKKLVEKCYEEMLNFLKKDFTKIELGIDLLEDENNITDVIHIFTAIRRSVLLLDALNRKDTY